MKKTNIFSGKTGFALILTLLTGTLLLSSCMKDPKPEPVGDAKIRYVNAVKGSSTQDFYVNTSKVGTSAVGYSQVSESITITSGLKNFFFTEEGTQTVNASTTGSIAIGGNYLLFFTKTQDGKFGIYGLGDNLAAPAAGKAKVRFVNMNYNFNGSIAVANDTQQLIPSLSFAVSSQYFEVAPGAKFTPSAPGVTNAPVIDGGLLAGKTYTIWIDGASSSELIGHVIVAD